MPAPSWSMTPSRANKQLVWLPWSTGSPPFHAETRLHLGCWLQRVQQGRLNRLPCSCHRADLGPAVFDSHFRDGPARRAITYRMYPDMIVIVEVLPDNPEFRQHTFPILRRLRDYERRDGCLEDSEWLVGQAADFLQLTAEQSALVDTRLALADSLLMERHARCWTQLDLATALGSSRSRVCKMELPDSSVSIDLLVKSLLRLGVARTQLGLLIAGSG